MLVFFPPKDMDDLKKTIKKIWDSIPKSICENIIEHMKYRWELCIKYKGRRLDKELLHKIPKINKQIKWQMKTQEINGIRVSYNDKFLLKLMNKDIREKKRRLVEQKKIEKEAKEKLDKLLRMRPKDYKNISIKEKKEIKEKYEHEKAKKEVYEEEIKNLEKMVPLDYLSVLNSETKEKLIGLCLNRKLIESFNEDGETKYEEDEIEEDEDEEADEDMEVEY